MKRSLEIELFAGVRTTLGKPSLTIEIDDQQTCVASDVLQAIANQYPEIAGMIPACRLAIDGVYVGHDHTIDPSCRFDLIPPVSGG
jgi:molybdopterin converting factor small subunit